MGKVYIANLGGHDYSDARRYGELVFLTHHGFNPKEFDRVAFLLYEQLKDFDPDHDYFLPVGQDLVNLTALYILSQQHGTVKTLYWDFHDRKYLVHEYCPALLTRLDENLKIKKEMMIHEH